MIAEGVVLSHLYTHCRQLDFICILAVDMEMVVVFITPPIVVNVHVSRCLIAAWRGSGRQERAKGGGGVI